MKILFVGDINIRKERTKIISKSLRQILQKHDFCCCNFEGPITTSDHKIKKAGPCLKQTKNSLKKLKRLGFNIINLANNHVFDYGTNSFKKTIEDAKENKQMIVGAGLKPLEAYNLKIVEKKATKVGLLSFSGWSDGITNKNTLGIAWISYPLIKKIVKYSKQKVDFLIIQTHAGLENFRLPLPLWRNKYRKLVDYGADMIIGHHPHVTQGFEKYKSKYIFYSLGNFHFNVGSKNQKSYCVSITLSGKDLTKISTILTVNLNKVCIQSIGLPSDNIKCLSSYLETKSYRDKINKKVLELWEKEYSDYFYISLNNINKIKSFPKMLKTVAKWILRKKIKQQEINFYYMLKNETHLYCISKALKLLSKK